MLASVWPQVDWSNAATTVHRDGVPSVAIRSQEAIGGAFATDATIEDPIGSEVRRGHESIHEFYPAFQDAKRETDTRELNAHKVWNARCVAIAHKRALITAGR
jgi:hypothetical protein